jgi:hypothetical protein
VEADLETTAAGLAELAEAGTVSREPAGRDAIWRAALSASAAQRQRPELQH